MLGQPQCGKSAGFALDCAGLNGVNFGVFPELGRTFDPSEAGLLGPLLENTDPRLSNFDCIKRFSVSRDTDDLHDTALFKYVGLPDLKLIMTNNKVRCAPPATFNDPFDVRVHTIHRFDEKDFRRALRNRIREFQAGKYKFENGLDETENARRIVAFLSKNWSVPLVHPLRIDASNFFSSAVALSSTGTMNWSTVYEILDLFANAPAVLADLNFERRAFDVLTGDLHLLCLSRTKSNLLMWAHYARQHTGAVIQFRKSELDKSFSSGDHVTYAREIPESGTVKQFVDRYLQTTRFDAQSDLKRMIFTKGADWSYEKEYRYTVNQALVGPDTYLHEISLEAVQAIYLGCRVLDELRCASDEELESLLVQTDTAWPDCNLFLTYPDPLYFGQNFVPVKTAKLCLSDTSEAIVNLERLFAEALDFLLVYLNSAIKLGNGKTEITAEIEYRYIKIRCELSQYSSPQIASTFREMIREARIANYRTKSSSARNAQCGDENRLEMLKEIKPASMIHGRLQDLCQEYIARLHRGANG